MGQAEKALAELNTVMAISEEVGDNYLQAQACRALGTQYSKLGRLQEAVETLQKHFQLTKKLLLKGPAPVEAPAPAGSSSSSSKNPAVKPADAQHTVTSQDLDIARAFIGVSRGNLLLGVYCVAMQSNLPALLDWKLNRTDIATNRTGLPTATDTSVEAGWAARLNDGTDNSSLHS
jgi:tetratricopeptide (TPR) repeat protein